MITFFVFLIGMPWFLYGASQVGGKVLDRLEFMHKNRRVGVIDVLFASLIFVYAAMLWPITRKQI